MVVITLEKCPLSLRGDLTKWMQEISLGVYVGQVSARVRDRLWERVCSEAKSGRATMVYSAQNEQRLEFRVHNTSWIPIDFDGIKLMLRPNAPLQEGAKDNSKCFSNVCRYDKLDKMRNKHRVKKVGEYVVVDIETTGLAPEDDEIVELAALRVTDGLESGRFQTLIKIEGHISASTARLTGLTDEDIERGVSLEDAVNDFLLFVGSSPIVMHNARFDFAFIDAALELLGYDELDNECIDTLSLARKKLPAATSHSLGDLANMLGIRPAARHRAMDDCLATKELFERLMAM